jgi:putative DNA primase/helicase
MLLPMKRRPGLRATVGELGAAAVQYALGGLAVFPLHGVLDGRCTCGKGERCDRSGKHPRTAHGLKDASSDANVVTRWWRADPSANIGIATGARSHILVLDIDGDAGLASLTDLVAAHELLPATPRVLTGKGWHLWFRWDEGDPRIPSRVGVRPGLDVRGEGGYVVAPPSVHVSGKVYEWDSATRLLARARLPSWLLEVLRGRPHPVERAPAEARRQRRHDGGPVSLDADIARVREALKYISAEPRDNWLTVGMALHRAFGAKGFSIWLDWSQGAPDKFNFIDQLRAWDSFGRGYPGTPVGLGTIFHMAKLGGYVPPRQASRAARAAGGSARTGSAEPRDAAAAAPETETETGPEAPPRGTNGADQAAAPPASTNGEEPPASSDDAEIRRLADLAPLDYGRARKAAAKKLGIPVGILDRAVDAERNEGSEHLQGQAIELSPPEPWDEPVDGDAVLDEISMCLTAYVVMSRLKADAIALWVVYTYLIDRAQTAPRLVIKSPEKRCGKTTLLSLLSLLVARALPASNVSPAALFRVIEKWHPTLLLDEADSFIALGGASPTPGAEELRGLLNSGHTRGTAFVLRTVGDDHEPRPFSTFAAIAIALIGKLPGTVEDRSIVIPLARRLPSERVVRFRFDRPDAIREIARRIQRWVDDAGAEIVRLDPEVTGQLNDRAVDNWRLLFAIADAAGGEWPERARAAAIELSREGAVDQTSTGTLLLGDIRFCFQKRGTDRLASEELVDALVAREDRPWAEWRAGRSLTKNGLASLLRKFGIAPTTFRMDDGRLRKGYYNAAFKDAFERYLDGDQQGPTGGPE